MRRLQQALILSLSLAAVATAPLHALAAQSASLAEGTEVHLRLVDSLSSKTATEDDTVAFTLDDDLKVGNTVVAKAGSRAFGVVSHAKRAGMMGKGGELSLRLDYLVAEGRRIKIRGSKSREGEGKVGTTVALTVLFGPIGLIKHGKEVEVKSGALLTAYTAEEVTVK